MLLVHMVWGKGGVRGDTELKFRLENLVHSPTIRSGDLKGSLFRDVSGWDISS